MRLKPQYTIFAFAPSLVSSHIIPKIPGIGNLTITFEVLGNTEIKAVLTNNGAKTLRLLKEGTILDSAPVQKFHVKTHDGLRGIPFEGIKKSIKYTNLSNSAFAVLEAGKTFEFKVDVASVHDVTMGGLFHILSRGRIPVANDGNNGIGGSVEFISNDLQIRIDGAKAKRVRKTIMWNSRVAQEPGSIVECPAKETVAIKNALQNCAVLATYAADMALKGPVSKFEEYFGVSDKASRQLVRDRFAAIAEECLTIPNGGKTRIHCNDPYQYCTESTIAFTISPLDQVTYCPPYWTLPSLTNDCHGQDQSLTAIHEFSHADSIYAPGTEDKAYGYENDMALPTAEKIKNADNHGLYVNSLWAGC